MRAIILAFLMFIAPVALGTPTCTVITDVNCAASSLTCSSTLSFTNSAGDFIGIVATGDTNPTSISTVSGTGWSETLTDINEVGNSASSFLAYSMSAASAHSSVALTVVMTGTASAVTWRIAGVHCTPDASDTWGSALDASTTGTATTNSSSFTPASLSLSGTTSTELGCFFSNANATGWGTGATIGTNTTGWSTNPTISSSATKFSGACNTGLGSGGNPPTITAGSGTARNAWIYFAIKERSSSSGTPGQPWVIQP